MKTSKNSTAINSGDCSSQRVLVMSMQSEAISSAELPEIISLTRSLLQTKQPSGLRLTAQVSMSIFRESTKTASHTQSSGMQPSGTSRMKEEESYVQTTLPLTYPTSARKQKNYESNLSAMHSPKLSSLPDRKQLKSLSQSQAKAKKSISTNLDSSTMPLKGHSTTSTAISQSKKSSKS
jgi:hypothetical protein